MSASQPAARCYYVSRTKAQHAALLAAVLALIGGGVLLSGAVPDAGLIGGLHLALAVVVGLSAVYLARDRSPRLTIDDEGIWFRGWHLDKLPWSEIADVYIAGSRVRSQLCVRVREGDRLLAGLPEQERTRLLRNPLVHLPELRVPNGALDAALPEVEAAIRVKLAGAPHGPQGA